MLRARPAETAPAADRTGRRRGELRELLSHELAPTSWPRRSAISAATTWGC